MSVINNRTKPTTNGCERALAIPFAEPPCGRASPFAPFADLFDEIVHFLAKLREVLLRNKVQNIEINVLQRLILL